MRFLILSVLLMELLSSGVYSVDVPVESRAKKLVCKNPKGKLGEASFFNCGQAVCKRSGKVADWDICPEKAKQETLEEIQTSVKETEIKVSETERTVKETEENIKEIKETVNALLLLAESNGNLPVAFYNPQEFNIEKNNLLTTLPYLGEEWILSFNVLLTTTSGLSSIIHLTLGGNAGVYGDRTPVVLLNKGGFYIASAINGEVNGHKQINPPIQAGKWIKFEISQLLIARKYIFEVKIDDVSYWVVENNDARVFKNIKVFAGDNFYNPAPGKIKNLKIQTNRLWAESNGNLPLVFYKSQEFDIEKNNLVTTLDLGAEWILSFYVLLTEVTPSNDAKSIIHVGIGGDHEVYGDRTPGVFCYGNVFHIASAINGDSNMRKNINPSIQARKWIKFEISQILIDNKYIFEVKIDDVSYWKIENNDARLFQNVKVFAGDNFYDPAPGKIKNLKIQTK